MFSWASTWQGQLFSKLLVLILISVSENTPANLSDKTYLGRAEDHEFSFRWFSFVALRRDLEFGFRWFSFVGFRRVFLGTVSV